MSINGAPGTWIPSHPHAAAADFTIPSAPAAVSINPPWNALPPSPLPQQSMPWNRLQPPAMCPPEISPVADAVKEYRTQVQVLSEQIAQMKSDQQTLKTSQESLQQSHDREILELRLQQTIADRDRLQRERELELQLQQQRDRELETIDSLSQLIENVVPAPSTTSAPSQTVEPPNAALKSTPRTTIQTRHSRTQSSETLPIVH